MFDYKGILYKKIKPVHSDISLMHLLVDIGCIECAELVFKNMGHALDGSYKQKR